MMDIQPIKTESDYDEALAKIERLWSSELNTPDGEQLDVLLVLVEDYEKTHYPIEPPDPIEAIKFYQEHNGLTRKDLEP